MSLSLKSYLLSEKDFLNDAESGDSIAVFQTHEDGSFELVNQVFTGLDNLRGFIFDPTGRYLVAGGNIAGGIKIFERVGDGSILIEVAATLQVPTASSFVWLPK